MAKEFLTASTEKMTIGISMAITGYSIVGPNIKGLWQLPGFVTQPLLGNISLVTVAAAMTLYGVFVLFTKY